MAKSRYTAELPGRISQQAAYLDEHPECVAVGGGG